MAEERLWWWYASRDAERYTVGPEESRDAVIQAGTTDFDGEPFYIVEGRDDKAPNLRILVGGDVLEQIDDCNEECFDPDGDGTITDAVTDEQVLDLTKRLNDAIELWAKENNIQFKCWAFGDTRNEERITPPARSDTQGSPA